MTHANTKQAALTIDQLHRMVPAAFSHEAAARCSERYQLIDSEDIITRLLDAGFIAVSAKQNASRHAEDSLTTRHCLRFRRPEVKPIVGDVFPEVGFVNGHNGGVRFEMFGGLYRLVCSNGLVAGMDHARVGTKHFGDISDVIEGSFRIVEEMKGISHKVEALQRIVLPTEWRAPFAGNAASMAYGEDHPLAIDPSQLLVPRRAEDDKADVWTTFNVIQENIMRGGATYQSATGRTVATKGITRIKRDINLNAALWDLAEQVAAKLDKEYRGYVAEDLLS